PSADGTVELRSNISGRQSNRGMEGLAISPDGRRLYGLMQSALIQDGALDASLRRIGTNNRLVEIDLESGAIREFLYQLEKPTTRVSGVLAVNDHRFLVIERAGNAGAAAAFKKIFAVDISGASDVRNVSQLPTTVTPDGIVPVTKTLFLDLLDPAFGLAGP